jgi:hypothetical protein
MINALFSQDHIRIQPGAEGRQFSVEVLQPGDNGVEERVLIKVI